MSLSEKSSDRPRAISASGYAFMHLLLVQGFVVLTEWIAFDGLAGIPEFAAWSIVLCAALVFSSTIHVLILDVLSDLDYRRRFAVFLIHVGVMISPWYFLRLEGPYHALSALLLVIAMHAVKSEHFGRIVMVCGLMVLVRACGQDGVPFALLAGWTALLLLLCRAQHVRFLLQSMREADGPPLRDEWKLWRAPLVLTMLVGTVVYIPAKMLLPPYVPPEPEFSGSVARTPMGPVSVSSMLWNTLWVIVTVIALLVLLNFIEKKLRQWRRKPANEEVPMEGQISRESYRPSVPEKLIFTLGSGPRERVIRAFAMLAQASERHGLVRGTAETAREFLRRVSAKVEGSGRLPDAVFNRACYSDFPIAEDEAEDFVRRTEQAAAILTLPQN